MTNTYVGYGVVAALLGVCHFMFRSDAAHSAETKGPDSHVAPARPDVSGSPASRARLCVSQFRARVVALCVRRRRHVCPARLD